MNQHAQTMESRTAMMALAEVCWEDQGGMSRFAPARIEDMSPSGVCIRITTAIAVGSKLTIRWQREQFSGVARNCRSDGVAFLMGIQRDKAALHVEGNPPPSGHGFEHSASLAAAELWWEDKNGTAHHAPARMESRVASGTCLRLTAPIPIGCTVKVKWQKELFSGVATYCHWDGKAYLLGIQQDAEHKVHQPNPAPEPVIPDPPSPPVPISNSQASQEDKPDKIPLPGRSSEPAPVPVAQAVEKPRDPTVVELPSRQADEIKRREPEPAQLPESQAPDASPRDERKVMETKSLFPKFWRHQHDNAPAPESATPMEVPMNKINTTAPEIISEPQGDLLSCEDIYHASGILSARSRYGINKIIEMLTSKHIREMSKDVKRASVLMALDAAGSTVDDVLQDAARRQHALTAYEAGQQKQFEEFEARNAKENAQIQAEMERVTAHYASRIKHNLDQVAKERDALRTWQAMKEQESQRISEAVGLCGKQPAADPSTEAPLSPPRAAAATV